MTGKGALPNAARTIRFMHFALFAGVAVMAIVLGIMRSQAHPSVTAGPAIGLMLSGMAVLALAVATALLRPRIAPRGSDQAPDDYWNTPSSRGSAMLLWAVIEGAGLIGVVGFYLTGHLAPIGVVVVALVLGALFRPAALEGH